MDAALRALNRFGLGARAREARTLGDPRGWLRAQLDGDTMASIQPPVPAEAIGDAFRALRMPGKADQQLRLQARRRLTDVVAAEASAALTARLDSKRPFVERLVTFWSNHLCVSATAKMVVAPFCGSYERDAIRPHVLGRFEDMVVASARHPAMLYYLDNFQSIGPGSRAAGRGRGGRGRRGLNENYARELLELHTLGVDGGYTQADVIELARALTGWTVDAAAGPVRFAFQPAQHEPGARTILGVRYPEDGAAQGERAIRDFCRHPSTARFVATKLVRHFVSDDPPAGAVNRIATVFRESRGDLRAVSAALIDLPEAWHPDTRKFRTPQDWLVAVLRAFDVTAADQGAVNALRQLRQPLWAPQAPKGYGDAMQDWADPDALLNRAELARTLVRRLGPRVDPVDLHEVTDTTDGTARTMMADRAIPDADRIALAVAGPAFQWR